MKKQLVALLAIAILFAACATPKKIESNSIANNGKVWASLWQQRSAEYKALCFQAYNTARWRLADALKTPGSKPTAIITDIDETVLDNSPYDAMRAANNQEYSLATWKAWTAKAAADTVPGAPAFLKYAATKGVTIFYITNRDEDERAGTVKNLQVFHLPNADDEHVLLKQKTSSKETRRQQVLAKYDVILLCGDNLPDFDQLYDNKPAETNRETITRRLMNEFGNKYIVIPNPSYGDFEGALFNYNYKLSGAQKDSVIRAKVKVDKQ